MGHKTTSKGKSRSNLPRSGLDATSRGGLQLKFLAPDEEAWEVVKVPKKDAPDLPRRSPTHLKIRMIQTMWGQSGSYEGCPFRVRREEDKDQFYFWVDVPEDAILSKQGKIVDPQDLVGNTCVIHAVACRYSWFDKEIRLMKMGWRLKLLKAFN